MASNQAETPRPALRSLIICTCSTYRRDNSLPFKQIPPCCRVANNDCSLRKGRIITLTRISMKLKFQELLPLPRGEGWGEGLNARRSFRRAKRFLPIGKNTYYCVSSLMPPKAVLYLCVFLFLWFRFFLFYSQ